jgi:hypothetical protein
VGGFIIGALLVGATYGVRAVIAARTAGAIAEAAGDILITEDKLRYLLVLDAGKSKGFGMLGYTLENAYDPQSVLAFSRTLITAETEKTVSQYGVKY